MISEKYKDCLTYIDGYWKNIIRDPKDPNIKTKKDFLPIPYPYIIPNDKKFSYIFYWDTFFMFRGLLGTDKEYLMKNMVENFIYLFKKYGVIPNFNGHASTGRSQPPFLTSMIFDVYNSSKNKTWLAKKIEFAQLEYNHVWEDEENVYNHRVEGFEPLAKYGDRDVGYAYASELESGWDFTSRFYNRCNEFLPVDLNSLLFRYEKDFARTEKILKNEKQSIFWEKRAKIRKKAIDTYFWDDEEGFFFDYDFVNGRRSRFYSLAGFAPLWAEVADAEQAERCVKKLSEFETKYGLVVTAASSLAPNIMINEIPDTYRSVVNAILQPKQWDYPNIWPPTEYLAVIGLLKYGYVLEAKRVMQRSLRGQAKVFRKYKTFFEKIDGSRGDIAANYHYINQSGFGWTNAVFYRYVQILDKMEKDGEDSIYGFPMPDKPPFTLSILH